MPKIYSSGEREHIRNSLIREAEKCLYHKGIEGTSVDELVKAVSIPKGTFYLFFSSKEDLFFEMLKSFRSEMEEKMQGMLEELDENHIVTSLTELFSFLALNVWKRGVFRIFEKKESMLLSRKLDPARVEEERKAMLAFFYDVFALFAIDNKEELNAFFTAYILILLSFSHADDFDNMESTARLLIRGLMLQLVGE